MLTKLRNSIPSRRLNCACNFSTASKRPAHPTNSYIKTHGSKSPDKPNPSKIKAPSGSNVSSGRVLGGPGGGSGDGGKSLGLKPLFGLVAVAAGGLFVADSSGVVDVKKLLGLQEDNHEIDEVTAPVGNVLARRITKAIVAANRKEDQPTTTISKSSEKPHLKPTARDTSSSTTKKEASTPISIPTPTPIPNSTQISPKPPTIVSFPQSAAPSPLPTTAETTASTLSSSTLSTLTATLSSLHSSLSNDLDSKLLSDLDGLDEQALRYRVVQLVAEMKDRTKWEVVRTGEFLQQSEKESSERWLSILRTQRMEFDRALSLLLSDAAEDASRDKTSALSLREAEVEKKVKLEFDQKALEFKNEMARQFEVQLNTEILKVKAVCSGELTSRVAMVNDLERKVEDLRAKVEKKGEGVKRGASIGKIVGGVLGLVGRIDGLGNDNGTNSKKLLVSDVKALKSICVTEKLISASLDKFLRDFSEAETPALHTVGELQVRFKDVASNGRIASYIGEDDSYSGSGLAGYAIGNLLAATSRKIEPKAALKITNVGELSDEARLVRAEYYCAVGDLRKTIGELDGLKKQKVKSVVNGWAKDCKARVSADEAARIMKARCSVLVGKI